MDCDRVGLVRRFYQASFGTKTNQETKQLSVSTILLKDDSNDLVQSTSDIQVMYIDKSTKSTAPDGTAAKSQPSLRGQAAQALATPQQEPVALFFVPVKSTGTNNIYYGGHWKVVHGEMIDPPKTIRGRPRQCRLSFEFVGVDQSIVQAINED
mmetsp:Transcript_9491/g.17296  ORF Transcript_9491/g.17296 Transcript_9491/m.17296 type:complete len:153 (+) Transcript_9491:2-460(+)